MRRQIEKAGGVTAYLDRYVTAMRFLPIPMALADRLFRAPDVDPADLQDTWADGRSGKKAPVVKKLLAKSEDSG